MNISTDRVLSKIPTKIPTNPEEHNNGSIHSTKDTYITTRNTTIAIGANHAQQIWTHK